jgi:glycosyltransferase involved in cell wall biosynthesis
LLGLGWKEKERLSFRWPRIKQFIRFASQSLIVAAEIDKKYPQNAFSIAYSYWLSQGALAAILLKQYGLAPVAISRAHGGDVYPERSQTGYLPLQGQMIAGLDEVVCISEHGAGYLRKTFPENASKITLSRLGVLPAPVKNRPSQDDRLHLVSCAYLSPVKRIDLLVEALAICDLPVTWTHLGGGPLEDSLRKEAAALPDNIQWEITGTLNHQDLLRFYEENPVDLFINVSVSEGLPVSIMEAMSYGIPVAATDVGGTSELVHDDQNGMLLPKDVTAQQISETLRAFYDLPEARKSRLRENAWQTWKTMVNAEIQFSTFTKHLLELIQSPASAPQ